MPGLRKLLLLFLVVPLLLLYSACAAKTSNPDDTGIAATSDISTNNGARDDIHGAAPAVNNEKPSVTADQATAANQTDGSAAPDNVLSNDSQQTVATTDPPLPAPTPTLTPTPDPPADKAESVVPEVVTSNTSDSPDPSLEPIPPDDEPVVLTICGDGVAHETKWTLSQLQSMRDGYREYTYSTTNNWPTFGYARAHGISLPYLLQQVETTDNWLSIRLAAADGYNISITPDEASGSRYAYAEHTRDGSGGAFSVDPIISWEWGEAGAVRPENLRFFIGQRGPMEVNTSAFVLNLVRIEVTSAYPGTWAAPVPSLADGSVVEFGTELRFTHDNMDSIRVYYTLDGSEPDYNSTVYNPSTSFFQPHLIKPVFLAKSVTVKAFAAGIGKEPSPVVTFSYTVSEEP